MSRATAETGTVERVMKRAGAGLKRIEIILRAVGGIVRGGMAEGGGKSRCRSAGESRIAGLREVAGYALVSGRLGLGTAGPAARVEGLEGRRLMSGVVNAAVSGAGFPVVTDASYPGFYKLAIYNAETDGAILDLKPGATVDLAKLPTRKINVVAEATWGTQSVKFGLNSNANYRVENSPAYSLTARFGKDIQAWNVGVGWQSVTVTGYTGDGAAGKASAAYTVGFNVIDSATPASTGGGTGGGGTGGGGGGTVTNPNTGEQAGGATQAVITTASTTVLPGQGFFASAVESKLKVGSAVTAQYAWDFGDGSAGYSKLEGFNAAHAYDRPGSYAVRLTVTDEAGNVSTAVTWVSVGAESRRTIYVSAGGNDSYDGLSTSWPVKTLKRAAQLMGDNTRVLLRRGDVYQATESIYVGKRNVEIGAWGNGGQPVLRRTNNGMTELIKLGDSATDVVIRDLAFDSDTPWNTNKDGAAQAVSADGTRVTVRGCTFLNVSDAINANGYPMGLLVQDNTAPSVTSVRGYLIWMQGEDVVVLGNRALNSTREHIVRVGGAKRVLMAYNNFDNQDRTRAGDWNDIAKGAFTVQKGEYLYITHNTASNGWIGVGPLGGADGRDDPGARAKWVVVEANAVWWSGITVGAGSENVSVRNNVIRRDSDEGILIRPTDSFVVNGSNVYAGRNVYNVTVAHNTMLNSGTNGNFLLVASPGLAGQVALVNNLLVAPNLVPGQSRTAAVYVADTAEGAGRLFSVVRGNVWDSLKPAKYAEGGFFYAYPWWSDPKGYLTPGEWQSAVKAQGERYGAVGMNWSNFQPASWGIVTGGSTRWAGVFADVNGKARPGLGQAVTPGAWQL